MLVAKLHLEAVAPEAAVVDLVLQARQVERIIQMLKPNPLLPRHKHQLSLYLRPLVAAAERDNRLPSAEKLSLRDLAGVATLSA